MLDVTAPSRRGPGELELDGGGAGNLPPFALTQFYEKREHFSGAGVGSTRSDHNWQCSRSYKPGLLTHPLWLSEKVMELPSGISARNRMPVLL
jgi:hypothetical protein